MNISIIGMGYVGLVTGACLAWAGLHVLCMDIDEAKVNKLALGLIPIYEPGLEEIVKHGMHNGRLQFTTELRSAVQHAEVILIAVDTPSLADGSCDLRNVLQVSRDIARLMESYKVIVTKSTVPVGTGRRIKEEMMEVLNAEGKRVGFDIVSNPEFLREGAAVQDFVKPDRIVAGYESEKALLLLKQMYHSVLATGVPLVATNVETAELIKYASNAFLATKISFINEIAGLCERCGADIVTVARAMGLDSRIGPEFLRPGPGFGGSCFPKDTKALVSIGKTLGYTPTIIEAAIEVNHRQQGAMLKKIAKAAGSLEGKTITVLGLAFKPETDDIRESPAVAIADGLWRGGAIVKVYDPRAMEKVKSTYPQMQLQYCYDAYSACTGSHCIVLATEWEEFRRLDFNLLYSLVETPVIVDLRNMFDPEQVKKCRFAYEGVGRN